MPPLPPVRTKGEFMSRRKRELASIYYQDKCEKLEREIKELNAANRQLETENESLKTLVSKYMESSKEMDKRYETLVLKLKTVSDELKRYRDKYIDIIKEAKIVAHRYKTEMDDFRTRTRKTDYDIFNPD